jgi:hypothetical protein
MAKIMEMNYWHLGFPERGQPHPSPEVPTPQRRAGRAGKNEAVSLGLCEARQVPPHHGAD